MITYLFQKIEYTNNFMPVKYNVWFKFVHMRCTRTIIFFPVYVKRNVIYHTRDNCVTFKIYNEKFPKVNCAKKLITLQNQNDKTTNPIE